MFKQSLAWIKHFPGGHDLRIKLIACTKQCFGISEAQLILAMEGKEYEPAVSIEEAKAEDEHELEKMLIPGGWLQQYDCYSKFNESPMSFHLVASMTVLGAAVRRKCYIDMGGVFRINGNCSALLIGPTGKVKKTTAIDLAATLVKEEALVPLMTGKGTSEAIMTELVANSNQFIYAPEFSVFMGRQRYMEGLTPMLLRLLDDPQEIEIKTISRGTQLIPYPTISILGGSTMSLLTSSTSDEVLSGGFLNRMLVVQEETTDRSFPFPRLGTGKEKLLETLSRIKNYEGAIRLSSAAKEVYETSYRQRAKAIQAGSESFAEISQRGTIHWLRLAMLTHLAECGLGDICPRCMKFAINFVGFLEKKLPQVAKAMDRTQVSQDSDYVVDTMRRLGGAADHSTLLRRVAARLNSRTLKSVIQTLEESGQLTISKRGAAQYYMLTKEED